MGKWACEIWLHQQWLGKLSNSKHLWATPPHYHPEHNVRISTSEQATSRRHQEPFTHPNLPLTASMVVTTQSFEQTYTTPAHDNNNTTMWNHPISNTKFVNLPAVCHPDTPTKTHSCNGCEQTASDTNQNPNQYNSPDECFEQPNAKPLSHLP